MDPKPCTCVAPINGRRFPRNLRLHEPQQDTQSPAWRTLCKLVDEAVADGRECFAPFRELSEADRSQIVTLPKSIAGLKRVKEFVVYGSSLVCIPPEIGDMTALETFTPYTSYRLHWFPYEITRCANLRRGTVSTRALFGNAKYRPMFPRLPCDIPALYPPVCSVCRGPFAAEGPLQRWLSLRIATDVLPLLVFACSAACIQKVPKPAAGYVDHAHQGGPPVQQPPPQFPR
ncbi:hypothetical protein [Acanthopleuribacter pedis]|uniref:Leucine-rich repeat domain-containing protein n=1 Tax=Acanthopleuribacter pedis TaxID=442870 RepID=A0A8J7QNQ3_9BACT|nr:hypothetical protein [Acanthopleuribacter pedis]MBO1321370.1 hypothetical protein [Acanthopleuribacter pedis]